MRNIRIEYMAFVRYAHISGDVFFSRRAAWQVASTMGFVLNKNTGSFLGLTQEDACFLLTCLCDCYVFFYVGPFVCFFC